MPTWVDTAFEGLRAAGLRRGGARRAVVDFLATQHCCRSAQEIHDGIAAGGGTVGVASVYRALDTLAELRLVQRVDVGDGIARFEPSREGHDHHHHLVCDDCGKVEPFADEALERALEGAAGRLGYAMEQHDVVLRGACDQCRNVGEPRGLSVGEPLVPPRAPSSSAATRPHDPGLPAGKAGLRPRPADDAAFGQGGGGGS